MKTNHPEERLKNFWGKVDEKHIASILQFVNGNTVLDMGCGYGTTTATLTRSGFKCTGIDYNEEVVKYALQRFPDCDFKVANAEEMPFESGSFDVIVLRDALHHFKGEADFNKVKKEILRVAKKNARIIFLDPNVNFMLRTMRKISAHKDEECNYEDACRIMSELNCAITYSRFNTLYSLPLSGGYVGINFVPSVPLLYSFLLRSESFFEKLVNKTGLGRYLCWRYLLVGERKVS